jgi:hypothetical protein
MFLQSTFNDPMDLNIRVNHCFDHLTLQPLSCCRFQHPSSEYPVWSVRTGVLYSSVLQTNMIAEDVPICVAVQLASSGLNAGIPTGCSQTDHHFRWFRSFYPQSVVLVSHYISPRHVCSSATIVLHNSIMSAPSTTPFDSEAPTVFRITQADNYLGGEWLKQSHNINIISCLLTH